MQIAHRDEFGELFNRLGFYEHGAEIGVFKGGYSETLRKTWENGTIHLIDMWKHNCDYIDILNNSDEENTENYIQTVLRFKYNYDIKIYRMSSIEASQHFPDKFFDWIYIDADHSYEGCKQDLIRWFPKLKKGGIFAGHDYLDEINVGGVFGVKTAVKEFINKLNAKLFVTQEPQFTSWYFLKESDIDISSLDFQGTCEINNNSITSDITTQKLVYADVLINNNRFQLARRILVEILSSDPMNINALNILSILEFNENNFDEVVNIISKVLEIEPQNKVALSNLNYFYKEKHKNNR